jgi:Right handed beta helix region
MRHSIIFCLIPIILGFFPCLSWANSWVVEKNGTGDFSVIQEAVDVAASGDTIQIGPGRYDDWQWLRFGSEIIYVLSEDKDLVFIGAGSDETIIGHFDIPFAPQVNIGGLWSFGEGVSLRVRDMGFENIRQGYGIGLYSGRIEVDNCRFEHCSDGIYVKAPEGGWVRNCQFSDIGYWPTFTLGGGVLLSPPSSDVLIEDCHFVDCFEGVGCYWNEITGITVSKCFFSGGRSGVIFADYASGTIRKCRFETQEWFSILGTRGVSIVIEDNEIFVNHSGSECAGFAVGAAPGQFSLNRNIISASNGNFCFRLMLPNITFDAQDNHFLREDSQSFFCKASVTGDEVPCFVDVTNNWWGTTDSQEIMDGILDGHDDSELEYFFTHIPFLDHPVSAEKKSLGSFKALFR